MKVLVASFWWVTMSHHPNSLHCFGGIWDLLTPWRWVSHSWPWVFLLNYLSASGRSIVPRWWWLQLNSYFRKLSKWSISIWLFQTSLILVILPLYPPLFSLPLLSRETFPTLYFFLLRPRPPSSPSRSCSARCGPFPASPPLLVLQGKRTSVRIWSCYPHMGRNTQYLSF